MSISVECTTTLKSTLYIWNLQW